jgi:hypothetical protein
MSFLSSDYVDSQLWATIQSAACGTALAAAMLYLVRDAARSFEEEDDDTASNHSSLAAACGDTELSVAAASVQVGMRMCADVVVVVKSGENKEL